MLLEVRQETKAHFLVGTEILGLLSIFNKSQASSPFEALNSVCLSRYQSDVSPHIQMRRRNMAFSRVCTGDSDIPSSWELKHEPAFKSLQGNPTLFRVRASRCPFDLRPQTQGPSHIPIAERILLLRYLRYLFKVGIPLESTPGNQVSSRADLGYRELFCVSAVTPGSL